jgi:branched-chain amino acid transport system substrate-binding protein
MKKSLWLTLLLVSAALILAGCSTTTTTQPATTTTTAAAPLELRIGAIQALTGPGSETGVRGVHGQEAAAEWINTTNPITINGQKYLIKIVGADFANDPAKVETAYNKLVFQDGVKFLIGAPFAPVFAQEAQLAERDKVFLIQQDGSGDELGPDTTMTFDIEIASTTNSKMYDYLLQLYPNIKTVALFFPNDPVAFFDKDYSKTQAEAHGLTVVAEASYDIGTSDYYPMWTKILPAKPDAVVSGMGFGGWKASAIKQARELGFTGPMLETSMSGDIHDVVGILGPNASDFVTSDADMTDPSLPAMVKQIAQFVKTKYNEDLVLDAVTQGWEPVWIIAQAIQQAQSVDPVAVKNSFEKTTGFDTPFGRGKLGGMQTVGINHVIVRPSVCYQIKNGTWTLVGWFSPELP